MTINVNVSGAWKEIADAQVKVSGAWQDTKEIYVKSNGVWELAWKRYIIPAGLIIPYNDISAPTGWTLFTGADGKFLVGAGNSYAVGDTGGVTSLTSGNTNVAGNHEGGVFKNGFTTGSGSRGHANTGNHTHKLTYDYTPPYYGLRLIKANSELKVLPSKAVMFSGMSLNGLTRFSSGDGKLFSARASLGGGGSNTISGFTSTSAGIHNHSEGYSSSLSGSTYGYRNISAGSHDHPNTAFTITPNLYRALLSAWTNASNAFNLKVGMYAFWESTTSIPDGWHLCNGSNGTLDLRNYFVEFTGESNDGTRTGNGTISVPTITLTSVANNHSHAGSQNQYYSLCAHPAYNNTHGHTIAASTPTFLPPFYALAIIQLAA